MKAKHLLYLIILSISCKSKDNNLFKFDPRSLEENRINLSEIADEINYIPLDNSIPLGVIYHNPKFINNSMFLFANGIGILAFNEEGKVLRKIGSIGRGPGEYIYGYNYTVDETNGTIYVSDIGNIIKVYSKNGKFLRSFSIKECGNRIDAIEYFNFKIFASCAIQFEDAEYEWIVLDTLGNLIKKKERRIPKFSSQRGGLEGTYKFENKISYWNQFTDTIFSIQPDLSEKPSFIINPGDYRLPRSNVSLSLEQYSQYLKIEQIFETNRFLVVKYFFSKEKNAFVLIIKENLKSFLTYLKPEESGVHMDYIGGIVNDIDGGSRFLPKSYYVRNGREYVFGLIYPYQVKALVATSEFKKSTPRYPEKKQELENLAARLKETDNPILMIVRLKK
ncbi:MAG: 6-bladed beta-propeller [Methanomethylovorans sp.]|nr:6-bladed beta-propeller [Methanomethylovorans sp.]